MKCKLCNNDYDISKVPAFLHKDEDGEFNLYHDYCYKCRKVTKKQALAWDKEMSVEALLDYMGYKDGKPITAIYTSLKRCSSSGMSRVIQVLIINQKLGTIQDISYTAAKATGRRYIRDVGIQIGGCGMDMGFALVNGLMRAIGKNEDWQSKIKHRWI